MDTPVVKAQSRVTISDLSSAKMGNRFARLDLLSQLAVLGVEKLRLDFEQLPRDRIGICLAVRAGSLSTDFEYWKAREAVGGPSPTLFAYTLPSSAVGEIAIRYQLRGPNLCFIGDADLAVSEASKWLSCGEIDACLCVVCDAVTDSAAQIIESNPSAEARAMFVASQGFEARFGEG